MMVLELDVAVMHPHKRSCISERDRQTGRRSGISTASVSPPMVFWSVSLWLAVPLRAISTMAAPLR